MDFSNNRMLKKLIGFSWAGILIHWFFQGLTYMDWLERIYKICIDLLLTILLALLLFPKLAPPCNWLLAFFLAHTMNFMFNGHLWTLLKHYGCVSSTKEKFIAYTEGLRKRISSRKYILFAAVYGSWARKEWTESSDLDIRIVRDGLVSGVRACSFVLMERSRALFNRFPLDIYVLDSFNRLNRLRADEIPEVIVDRRKAGRQT